MGPHSEAQSIQVTWPSGRTTEYTHVRTDNFYVIEEGMSTSGAEIKPYKPEPRRR
jgi:hypothetical protein